jgi:hypothetical protein
MRAAPCQNLIGSAHTVILPILDSVNLAYAPTKALNDAIRMTYLRLFTVGSLKPFKGFNDSHSLSTLRHARESLSAPAGSRRRRRPPVARARAR